MYNLDAETHLDGGVMFAFVFQSASITQTLVSTFIGSTALWKDPQRF